MSYTVYLFIYLFIFVLFCLFFSPRLFLIQINYFRNSVAPWFFSISKIVFQNYISG